MEIDVAALAKLARLEVSAEELAKLEKEIPSILAFVETYMESIAAIRLCIGKVPGKCHREAGGIAVGLVDDDARKGKFYDDAHPDGAVLVRRLNHCASCPNRSRQAGWVDGYHTRIC